MIVDCIADLHGNFPELEGGDLLIVAGDLTAGHTEQEYDQFQEWAVEQFHNYGDVIIVAGNHDSFLQKNPDFFDPQYLTYLCDQCLYFTNSKGHLKIWGSPWTRTFEGMNPHCKAFTCETEDELAKKWMLIPTDIDILITHSPPFTILDKTVRGDQVGSTTLMAEHVHHLRPQLWVFGHIHAAYGQEGPYKWARTKYVNASHVNEEYEPVNKPIRVIL